MEKPCRATNFSNTFPQFFFFFFLVVVINFKCTHLQQAALREGVQFVSWHNLTAVHQQTPVKLEVVSHRHQDPRCTTGKVEQVGFWRSEQRVGLRLKTPRWSDRGGGSRSVCSGLCCPFAVGMAWSSRFTGTGSQGQRQRFRFSLESGGASKVRAEVDADAGRALSVVRRGTQIPQALLLQAARVAAGFGGIVVAGGRGVPAGHLLKGAGEDGAGGTRQAGEGSRLGHRLAGGEGQSFDRQLCVLAGGPGG